MRSIIRLSGRLVSAGLVAGLVAAAGMQQAGAQGFPNKPIKFVLPLNPGGLGDSLFRPAADALGVRLGTSIVVENRPGAGSVLGIDAVVRSPADGYTLLFTASDGLGIIPSPVKLPYDPAKDLVPVVKMTHAYSTFAVAKHVPVKTIQELIAYAKKNPGKLSFSSTGFATATHMNGELLKARAGIDIVHVPYKGTTAAVTDAIAGRIDIISTSPSVLRSFVERGELRFVVMTSPTRDPSYPEIPTMIESGFPGFIVGSFFGVFAPSGVPRDILQRLAKEIGAVAASDEFVARSAKFGSVKSISLLDDFAKDIATETTMWHTLVREQKIRLAE
jgi:tripartite-type tricarboxylate transporter receptor subunit TctC